MTPARIVVAALAGAALVACGLNAIGTGESVGGPGPEASTDAGADVTTSGGDDGTIPISDGGLDGCPGVNVTADPKNCGACGHDCLGGGCEAGACQPFRIGMLDASATSLAVNDSGVYWVVQFGSAVLGCPPEGCAAMPGVLAASLTSTVAVVDVGGTLAVLDDQDLHAVTTPGGASVAIYPGVGTINASSALCTDGTGRAYFITNSGGQYIDRIFIDGGGVARQVTSSNLDALGCGAGHALWEINSGIDSIYACDEPADCGIPAPIGVVSNGGETHIVATADHAYFTRRFQGTLNRCSIAGCFAPTVLFSGYDLNGVAVDNDYVYFTSAKGGVIARCNQDGCGGASYRALAANQVNPHALIADDKALYWATDSVPAVGGDAGTPAAIYRLAK